MKIFSLFFLCAVHLFAQGIEDAVSYHKHSGLQWDVAVNFMKEIDWREGEKIVDVGCGDGKITACLAAVCPSSIVMGVDVSWSMIQFASAYYEKSGQKNLFFLQSDALSLPFVRQFDKVVSFSTLHWVLDQKVALQKMYDALTPQGSVHILTYAKAPMNIMALSERLICLEKWKGYFPEYRPSRVYFTEEEYKALLEEVGFVDVKVRPSVVRVPYANRKELGLFIEPLLTFTSHLSISLKQQFLEELIDEIAALQPKESSCILFEVKLLHVHAKR